MYMRSNTAAMQNCFAGMCETREAKAKKSVDVSFRKGEAKPLYIA
jgi:hypothetical protein